MELNINQLKTMKIRYRSILSKTKYILSTRLGPGNIVAYKMKEWRLHSLSVARQQIAEFIPK